MYRIVMTCNIKSKKTVLFEYKTLEEASNCFFRLKYKKAHFPKRYANIDKKLHRVTHKIHLVRPIKPTDKPRSVRDELGRIVEEPQLYKSYYTINSAPFEVEEEFYVWSSRLGEKRMNIVDLIRSVLMKGIDVNNPTSLKTVVLLRNKIVFRIDDHIDIVVCKDEAEGTRLYNTLSENVGKSKLRGVLFLGKCIGPPRTELYKLIFSKTGWSNKRVYISKLYD